jgi:hypothetical protein
MVRGTDILVKKIERKELKRGGLLRRATINIPEPL